MFIAPDPLAAPTPGSTRAFVTQQPPARSLRPGCTGTALSQRAGQFLPVKQSTNSWCMSARSRNTSTKRLPPCATISTTCHPPWPLSRRSWAKKRCASRLQRHLHSPCFLTSRNQVPAALKNGNAFTLWSACGLAMTQNALAVPADGNVSRTDGERAFKVLFLARCI